MEGERLGGSIYHVSDLNVYLGRQRVDPNGRKGFTHVLCPEQQAASVLLLKYSPVFRYRTAK